MDVLSKRFGKYGLNLHSDKTRLIDFRKPQVPEDTGKKGHGSFDLLGFTFFWAKSRKGNWVVKRRTAKSRFRTALSRIKEWCRANRHRPVGEQQQALAQKLRGHCGYFGITGNSRQIAKFRYEVVMLWCKWLSRRSQKARMNWETFSRLLKRYPLPAPIAIHSIYCAAAKP
jgi:RNA-directed DNA polymerase